MEIRILDALQNVKEKLVTPKNNNHSLLKKDSLLKKLLNPIPFLYFPQTAVSKHEGATHDNLSFAPTNHERL